MENRRIIRKKYKQMIRHIPTSKDYIQQEYTRDESGRLILNVCPPAEIFNPLSSLKQLEVSDEVFAYLDNKIYYLPTREGIHIHFNENHFSNEKKQQITECIQEHYLLILKDKKEDLLINSITVIGLALLGTIFLGPSFMEALDFPLINETLSIIGSFSMWEAVDLTILERKVLKTELYNACQSADAKISFE